MRRQIASLLLTLVLLAASCPANAAFAASAGRFADVAADAWYYEYVDSLCRLGLLRGQGAEDRFDPDGQVTVAQAVTLAARLRSLLDWGDGETGPGQYGGELWYQPYLAYLQAQGALGDELAGTYDLPATRAQTAHVLAGGHGRAGAGGAQRPGGSRGYASRRRITDVTDATPYREDILRLYRWGILDGADGTGSFLPQATLRRSELSAMAARLADPSLRLSLEWDQLAYSSRREPRWRASSTATAASTPPRTRRTSRPSTRTCGICWPGESGRCGWITAPGIWTGRRSDRCWRPTFRGCASTWSRAITRSSANTPCRPAR